MNCKVTEIFSRLIFSEKRLHIKLLGDSITHGAGGTGWKQNGEPIVEDFKRSPDSYCWANLMRDFLESQYNCEVINNGCSGTTIEFVIENFNTLVSSDDDIIVCTIGTNNRHQYAYSETVKKSREEMMREFYSNILKLNEMLKATGKEYVLVANIPASAENEEDTVEYWRILHMNDIHDMYLKAHLECGFAFIDLYTDILAYCDVRGIDFETLLADGLHPNDAGYDVMFRLLLRNMGLGERKHNNHG